MTTLFEVDKAFKIIYLSSLMGRQITEAEYDKIIKDSKDEKELKSNESIFNKKQL